MPAGRPLKFKTAAELQKKIDAYFRSCFGNKWFDEEARDAKGNLKLDKKQHITYEPVKRRVRVKPCTITGLAVALKCDRETLLNYEKKEEFFGTIKQAKAQIHEFVEEELFKGKAVGPIFNLKNNFGWKDKTETEHTIVGLNEILDAISNQNR